MKKRNKAEEMLPPKEEQPFVEPPKPEQVIVQPPKQEEIKPTMEEIITPQPQRSTDKAEEMIPPKEEEEPFIEPQA